MGVVKARIQLMDRFHGPWSQRQVLMFNGRVLADASTMTDYNIQPDARITLCLRMAMQDPWVPDGCLSENVGSVFLFFRPNLAPGPL